MPSSKRARVIPTSKTRRNRKELVHRLADNIKSATEKFSYIWVFDVENMRNNFIKQVRVDLADSRIFMGKTKVMAVALGQNSETEHVPGVSGLGQYIKGEVGLLFTDRAPIEIEQYFAAFVNQDFARSGAIAPREVKIPPGELYTMYGVDGGEEDLLPLSIEPTLRKLGIPTRILKGKVVLEDTEDFINENVGYIVCREGDSLDSRQTSILKIFGVRMAQFKVELRVFFDKQKGLVQKLGSMEVDG